MTTPDVHSLPSPTDHSPTPAPAAAGRSSRLAVVGAGAVGTSTAYAALLGVVVIQSISSGLTLLNLDSSVRFMVTGVVLVLAVIVDSLSRRTRAATGRA